MTNTNGAYQTGRDFYLEIEDEENLGNYLKVGGFTSHHFSMIGDYSDVTSGDSNGYREVLGCGNKSLDAAGRGRFASSKAFVALSNKLRTGDLVTGRITVPGHAVYACDFLVNSMAMSGEVENEVTYDINLVSSGEITLSVV